MKDRSRLRALLIQDKAEMSEAMKNVAVADFKRVANEYFETSGDFGLTLSRDKTGDTVTLTFHIVRVKNFTTLH